MSALEAFSTGTPTVLRDLDLYRAIIDGYYLAGSDREAMQAQLTALHDQPELREELSKAGLGLPQNVILLTMWQIFGKISTEQASLKTRGKSMTRRNGIVFTIMMLIGLGGFLLVFRKISWTQFASVKKCKLVVVDCRGWCDGCLSTIRSGCS